MRTLVWAPESDGTWSAAVDGVQLTMRLCWRSSGLFPIWQIEACRREGQTMLLFTEAVSCSSITASQRAEEMARDIAATGCLERKSMPPMAFGVGDVGF